MKPAAHLMLAVMVLALLCSPTFCETDNRPIVVVREDDCRATWRTPFAGLDGLSALQYGKQKHIPITWAIISDRATTGFYGYSLVWSELLDYLSVAGGEAASHSGAHTAMSSDEAYINELVRSKAAIEANLPGYACTTFLQPGTWTGNAHLNDYSKLGNPIGLAIQSTYERSQGYLGGGWMVGPILQNYGICNSYALDYGAGYGETADMQAHLDIVAETPGLLFVIVIHGVQETGGTNTYEAQADKLKAFMDRIADLRDSGKIRLMTMRDAYIASASFSPNLNHIIDPGFELCNPEPAVTSYPWKVSGTGQIMPNGGVDNSRYASLRTSSDQLLSRFLGLAPGRYELNWYQRPEPGFPTDKALGVWMWTSGYGTGSFPPISSTSYTNSNPSVWERRTAVFAIRDQQPWVELYSAPRPGGAYGIDNVSIVSAPLNPDVSPTGATPMAAPTQLTLTWITPPSAVGNTIRIRYSPTTSPLTPADGSSFGDVPAVPNTVQSATASFAWQSCNYLYFSVFSVAPDGSYSPQDVVAIAADKTAPSVPTVSYTFGMDGTINVAWSSTDPDAQSGIYGYEYKVGTSPGLSDIVPTTFTAAAGTSIHVPAGTPQTLYLSVRAQNLFGYWSSSAPVVMAVLQDIGTALSCPDGSTVRVSGMVSAVFSDCLYVEDSDRTRGLRVDGLTGYAEGSEVTVTGVLSTAHGERVITPVP